MKKQAVILILIGILILAMTVMSVAVRIAKYETSSRLDRPGVSLVHVPPARVAIADPDFA
jgi:hypothetical protein